MHNADVDTQQRVEKGESRPVGSASLGAFARICGPLRRKMAVVRASAGHFPGIPSTLSGFTPNREGSTAPPCLHEASIV